MPVSRQLRCLRLCVGLGIEPNSVSPANLGVFIGYASSPDVAHLTSVYPFRHPRGFRFGEPSRCLLLSYQLSAVEQ